MSILVQILGATLVMAGVALWSVPAAMIVAGLALFIVGFLAESVDA